MGQIKVEKSTPEKLDKLETEKWGDWSCDISKFDWEYDATETCYIIEGEAEVTTSDGESVSFGAGDIVVFPKGINCTWNVTLPIRKKFRFD